MTSTTRWVLRDTTTRAYWSASDTWDTNFDKAELFNYYQAEATADELAVAEDSRKVATPGTIEILTVKIVW